MPYIRYKGQMYNVTDGEYIDTSPTLYSMYRYTGTDLPFDYSFITNTNINWAEYGDGDLGSNVGVWFEYYAKQYYYNSGLNTWPILRLISYSETDYIEWNHDEPSILTLKAHDIDFRIKMPYMWNDTITLDGEGVPRFNSLRPRIFINAADKDEIENKSNLIYGVFVPDDTTGGWNTRYGCNIYGLIPTDTHFFIYDADTYMGFAGNDAFHKFNDGYALIFWRKYINADYKGPVTLVPAYNNSNDTRSNNIEGWDGKWTPRNTNAQPSSGEWILINGIWWGRRAASWTQTPYDTAGYEFYELYDNRQGWTAVYTDVIDRARIEQVYANTILYTYLTEPPAVEPPSDVDPEDIPPADEPPAPIPPDDPDPYYDPTSDPRSPSYDPVKDPTSPSYDPSVPATPYQPIIQQTITYPAPIITPPDPIPAPETPATYVNTSRLFTIFTPTVSQLTDFANFLWASPTDIVPTFRKIVANPMDCVLGLMVIPQLSFTRQSRELNIGNIGTGITMDYAPSQFVDFDCGQLFLQEYYRSYLDYSPYTKVDIFLPFIGTRELSIDECMQKTIGISYRFDLATGTCVAFIKVNGTVLYQFEGNCASHIPLSSADWGSTVKAVPTIAAAAIKAGGLIGGGPIGTLGVAAAASVMSMKERHPHAGSMSGSAGLMGVLYPYLIVTRPCQALPESQNSFTGYPSFITLSLSECSGYTEVEQVHLEHVPATGDELIEIERLLKEGVLF